ncbi:hypothetical protein NL676_028012 [Syzygium grande]|nr:hypothetical protein NL676_028012 [Syzygium grande]
MKNKRKEKYGSDAAKLCLLCHRQVRAANLLPRKFSAPKSATTAPPLTAPSTTSSSTRTATGTPTSPSSPPPPTVAPGSTASPATSLPLSLPPSRA